MPEENLQRRPLKTRQAAWAKALAQWLSQKKVPPNMISLTGIGFAFVAALSFANGRWEFQYLLAAACIQLRLLCNMLDGMVAIEGGLKSKLGDLYNELPDRVEDALILVAAGYSLSSPSILGWLAAVLAVLTAYIRAFGASLGTKQYFCGPMAKPHRMFVMTVACLLEFFIPRGGDWIFIGLFVVIVGAVITCVRRVYFIVKELESK